MNDGLPAIGVAIVTFNSSDVILACLDSLFASDGVRLRVAIADNASSDETIALVRDWAARHPAIAFEVWAADDERAPAAGLTIVHSPVNGGYAHGVNLALTHLLRDPGLDLFWVLNPDCEVAPETARLYCEHGADGQFALMSGRTVYREGSGAIQTDGGRVHRWTGVCKSVNAGADPATATLPDPHSLDYLTGANLVASRRFIERAGLMTEDYFLYYEEVDWAFRRGDLPLRLVPGALVYHHGGTSIGSGTATRRASPFANYFNYRNRIRFMRRHRPAGVPIAMHTLWQRRGSSARRVVAPKQKQWCAARSAWLRLPMCMTVSLRRKRGASLLANRFAGTFTCSHHIHWYTAMGARPQKTKRGSPMEYKDNQAAEVNGMLKDVSVLLLGIAALGGLITLILVWMQGS